MSWTKPKCKITQKFPFIPTEKELDDLIAGSGKKNAAFCQTLKETAIRSGEAKRLQWTDIDFERNVITLNEPEKGSNPRMWKEGRADWNAQYAAKAERVCLHRLLEIDEDNVSENSKTPRSQPSEPKTPEDKLPHLQALEGNHAVPRKT